MCLSYMYVVDGSDLPRIHNALDYSYKLACASPHPIHGLCISPQHTHPSPPPPLHRIVSSDFFATPPTSPRDVDAAAYRILPLACPSPSPPTTTTTTTTRQADKPLHSTHTQVHKHALLLLLLPSPRYRHQLCLPHHWLHPRFPHGACPH